MYIFFPVKFCFKTKKPGYIIAKSPTTIHVLQSSDYCGCEGLYSGAAKQQTPVPNISPSYRNIPQLKKHTQNISEQTQALHTALSNPSIQQHSTQWNSWGIQLVVKPCTQEHPMIQNILSYSGDILQWGYPTAGIFYNWNDPTEGISYTVLYRDITYSKDTLQQRNYIVCISFIRCPTAEIYPTEGYPTEGISNIGGILQQTDILQQISTVHVTVGMLSYAVSMRISNFIVLIWHSYNNSYYLYNHS